MDNGLTGYRQGLVDTQRKLTESYDKLLVALSGGSLAFSMVFLKDVAGPGAVKHLCLLLTSWSFFVVCLTAVLLEIFFGIWVHKQAIIQVDEKKIHDEIVGRKFAKWSTVFHLMAGLTWLLGLSLLVAFVFFNLGGSKNV